MPERLTPAGFGRRAAAVSVASWLLLLPRLGWTALPPGVEGRRVRIQLDDGALQAIPGDERADVTVTQDTSPAAQALIRATPPERFPPVIYVVVGVLSVPVIWDTIREMLRRDQYGGVLIDARRTPALITYDKTLPADLVLFIDPDGHSQRYESRNIPADLLLKISKAL
jgi:hypothetical protein